MRIAVTRSAVFAIAFAAALPAIAASSSDVPAFLVESRNVDGSVTYRFTLDAGAPAAAATPFASETIRFATFDLDHVRLTLLDATGHDTAETIVAEHEPDGEVHPKLKAGSHWAVPVALYDRLAILAAAASAPVFVGKPVTAKLQPVAAADEIDGTIVRKPGKETHLIYDAAGSATPSRELVGDVAGAATSEDRGRPGGGGPPGFGRSGGHGRRGSDDRDQPHKADATIHIDAVFIDGSLQRAESSESLASANAGGVAKQSWTIVRIP